MSTLDVGPTSEPETEVPSVIVLGLQDYFRRIGWDGPVTGDLATLRAILRCHVQSIPFENIDVLLGRGVELTPEAIWGKLVNDERGGYCFEHNSLLLWVLRAVGFDVTPLSARVRLGRPPDFVPARTHMFLRVELHGQSWLVDGGVGGLSPTAPLALQEGVQPTPHEPRRLLRMGDWDGWERRAPTAKVLHQAWLGDTWHDVYEFTLEGMPEIDRTLANWYLTTHPQSHFRDRLMLARASETGRKTLLNREFTTRTLDGTVSRTVVESPRDMGAILVREFGIHGVDANALFLALPS